MKAYPSSIRLALVCFCIGMHGLTAEEIPQAFEVPSDRKAPEILSAEWIKGPHHKVRETVHSHGYLYHFTVDSKFGEFQATGMGALRKLVREIQAIAALKKMQQSKAYINAVGHAATAPVRFGKSLIKDPADTLSGIPKGATKLLKNALSGRSKDKDDKDSAAEQILQVSKSRRQLAHKLGVDVFSSNPVLQKELNRIAWADALGSLSVTAALAPIGGAMIAVKSTNTAQALSESLADTPPAELQRKAKEALEKMGVDEALGLKFQAAPGFTPRHRIIIVKCLDDLENARGRDKFIRFTLFANDEVGANFMQQMAEILRACHKKESPIVDLDTEAGLVFARAKDGTVMVPFPADRVIWSRQTSEVVTKGLAAYKAPAEAKMDFWVSGTLSPVAKARLKSLGITARENVGDVVDFVD